MRCWEHVSKRNISQHLLLLASCFTTDFGYFRFNFWQWERWLYVIALKTHSTYVCKFRLKIESSRIIKIIILIQHLFNSVCPALPENFSYLTAASPVLLARFASWCLLVILPINNHEIPSSKKEIRFNISKTENRMQFRKPHNRNCSVSDYFTESFSFFLMDQFLLTKQKGILLLGLK